jgi:hypothetical protein
MQYDKVQYNIHNIYTYIIYIQGDSNMTGTDCV